MPDENKNINPQITSIQIGARSLREIKIYPLTVGPQLQTISAFGQVGNAVQDAMDDFAASGTVIGLIVKHLPEIIEHLIDPEEDKDVVLKDLTFAQLEELGQSVYETNFESLGKKAVGLFVKAMTAAGELPDQVKKEETPEG